MTIRTFYIFALFLSVLQFSSCSISKHLEEGQLLYRDTEINFQPDSTINKPTKLRSELLLKSRPQPNTGLNKAKSWLYVRLGETGEKGFKAWLKRTFGEPPALYNESIIERSKLVLGKHMLDNGYFQTSLDTDTTMSRKKVSMTYNIHTTGQYHVNQIEWPQDSSPVNQLLSEYYQPSILKVGQPYQLTNIDAERSRLTNIANDKGFYDFSTGNIFVIVDTTAGPLLADLFLRIQGPTDSTFHKTHYFGPVCVFPDYDINRSLEEGLDTVQASGLTIIQKDRIVRPQVLSRMIRMEEGNLYSRSRQEMTIQHLLDLGVFKFVNVRYQQRQIDKGIQLTPVLNLTPGLMRDVTAEFQVNNRNGSYLGLAAAASFTHRNLFKGAEQFQINLSGGIETGLRDTTSQNFINSIDLSLQMDLYIPKLIIPFHTSGKPKYYIPRTRINLGNTFQRRTELYYINSTNLRFGYDWKENRRKRHQLNPISVNLVNLYGETDKFLDLLAENPRLQTSFQDNFIAGLTYTYTYNAQNSPTDKQFLFFRVDAESAGNAISLFNPPGDGETNKELLGVAYAQYARLAVDVRHYWSLRGEQRVAARFIGGMGLPYGNSVFLPYVKQFISGGANSIRAFRLREVGPGSYNGEDGVAQSIDRTGDIKLEANVEYRFGIFSYLKGAVFLDAGNVWLLDRPQETRKEGIFHFDQFVNEIAIGTGLGFRLDFNFFVLRLDASFPLHNPNLPMGERWTFDKINPLKLQWRRDNLVWHLAIGYPF